MVEGDSMMKGIGSPFMNTLPMIMPVMPSTIMLVVNKAHETSDAEVPKTAAHTKASTARRAVHGTKGDRNMVRRRAFFDSMMRAPITEGTLQPKPRHKGRKLLP